MNSTPFSFTIPVEDGELRVIRNGAECAIERWAVYPGDRGMMRGGVVIATEDLALLIHGLKRAAWLVDRDHFPQQGGRVIAPAGLGASW